MRLLHRETAQSALQFLKRSVKEKGNSVPSPIAGGKENGSEPDYCPPCGVCRQVMREFCENSFEIILARSETDYRITSLGELLPESFGPDFVKEEYDA